MSDQDAIKQHFERLHRQRITPWKNHGTEPLLDYFFHHLSHRHPRGRLLDIGCGDGWLTIRAAKLGLQGWGIDSSETAILRAREYALAEGCEQETNFIVGDALDLPYQDSFFDALLDRGLFHHIVPDNRPIYLSNIRRVLRNHAMMYLAVFSHRNLKGIGQRFDQRLIEKIFGQDFRIVVLEEDPYPTPAPAHLLHILMVRKHEAVLSEH